MSTEPVSSALTNRTVEPCPLPLPQILRADSVGASRPTSGLGLQRTLEIHFPVLSRYMFEAELYPLLPVSRAMHAQIRREIAHAQAQEKLKSHRMRVEIEDQLSSLHEIRSHLSASEQEALDVDATASCRELITAGEFGHPASDHCRSVIARGGRVWIPDLELQRNLSDIARTLVQNVESSGQHPLPLDVPAPEALPAMVQFMQHCFLSNPRLWRNKQYVGNGGYSMLEMLMETMLSRLIFARDRPRRGVHMHYARATAEILLWIMQLLLLQPPFRWHEWRHADQHLLLLCTEHITKHLCVTSAEMIVHATPQHVNDIAELKQLRWSIVRQCAGGPDAHSLSQPILRLNAPLLLPSFHPHELVYHQFCKEATLDPDVAAVCAGCGLIDEHSALMFQVFVCAACNFRMHADCVTTTPEAQAAGFKARTAQQVHQMLQDSATATVAEPAQPIPADVLDDLRTYFHDLFVELPSARAVGLMTLLLESSPALCQSMQAALNLPPPPRDCGNPQRSMAQHFNNTWMRDNGARQRLLTLLCGQSKFRSVVMQRNDPNHASSSRDDCVSSQSIPFSFLLLFDLIRRKERRPLQCWLNKDRAYFTSIWPRLIDPDTGCSPLLYLVAHVRGCREYIFVLLARFTCTALRIKPADLLTQRTVAGQSLAEMLEWDRNRDLRGIIEELATGP